MNRHETMTEKVKRYLLYRQELGYSTKTHRCSLIQFASYADRIRHRGTLTISLAVNWARLPTERSPQTWASRLKMVRCLARYLAIDEPKTEIPPVHLLGPGHARKTPFIYSEADISALLTSARQLQPLDGLRPRTYATLIGLFACTGLRLSEGLKLMRSDFDGTQGVLTIRETKFHKSRRIPLHTSATKAMRGYLQVRDRIMPLATTGHFFLNDRGTPLNEVTVHQTFRRLCDGSSITTRDGERKPRLHDLRHTFACRRIQRWYETGTDVNHAIAALSAYLGHSAVTYTYWYLTATPELLDCAVARFIPLAQNKESQR